MVTDVLTVSIMTATLQHQCCFCTSLYLCNGVPLKICVLLQLAFLSQSLHEAAAGSAFQHTGMAELLQKTSADMLAVAGVAELVVIWHPACICQLVLDFCSTEEL